MNTFGVNGSALSVRFEFNTPDTPLLPLHAH